MSYENDPRRAIVLKALLDAGQVHSIKHSPLHSVDAVLAALDGMAAATALPPPAVAPRAPAGDAT